MANRPWTRSGVAVRCGGPWRLVARWMPMTWPVRAVSAMRCALARGAGVGACPRPAGRGGGCATTTGSNRVAHCRVSGTATEFHDRNVREPWPSSWSAANITSNASRQTTFPEAAPQAAGGNVLERAERAEGRFAQQTERLAGILGEVPASVRRARRVLSRRMRTDARFRCGQRSRRPRGPPRASHRGAVGEARSGAMLIRSNQAAS